MSLSPAPTMTGRAGRRPRVLVVDDSAVVRGLVARWVEADDRLDLAGTCADGEQGVRKAGELQPDLVVLDVEMPRMDGLTALPLILKAAPRARAIMASTLTLKGGEVTMRALSLGAADYAPKPEAGRVAGAEGYRVELLQKLVALAGIQGSGPAREVAAAVRPAPRPFTVSNKVELLLIGSSTGGPQALREVASALPRDTRQPVVIVQHMPKLFTAILAEHLSKVGLPASEAIDGEVLKAGHVYIAPGDNHLTLRGAPGAFTAHLDQSAPVNFCRPAVDPMFSSAAAIAGRNCLAVVLTGMGHDGREGVRKIREAGGRIIAQDQATSVVWGMPGAVAEAGLADQILPLSDIGPTIARHLKGQM